MVHDVDSHSHLSQIRSEDWILLMDFSCSQNLRFAFGAWHTNISLPFGLDLSLHTFTKCVNAALASLHLGHLHTIYIDDWLILAQSAQMAAQHRDVVFAHLDT